MEREPIRQYRNFRNLMNRMTKGEEAYGRGRLKDLRRVLKEGETETENYLQLHKISELGRDVYHGIYKELEPDTIEIGSGNILERRLFTETADGKSRNLLFDVLELMDTYLRVEDVE